MVSEIVVFSALGGVFFVIAILAWRVNETPGFMSAIFMGVFCVFIAGLFLGSAQEKERATGILAVDSAESVPFKTGVVYETVAVYPQQNTSGYICAVLIPLGILRYYYTERPLPRFFTKTTDGQYVAASPPKKESKK